MLYFKIVLVQYFDIHIKHSPSHKKILRILQGLGLVQATATERWP